MSDAPPRVPGLVLIVGAGPVGLTLASLLHRQGLACRIIDKAPEPTRTSKALVIWGRTMEMLDDLGLVDRFLDRGFPLQRARIFGNTSLLVEIPFEVEGTHYPKPTMLSQAVTEELLTEHLESVGIPVERPVELLGFDDLGDHIRAKIRYPDGGVEESRFDWIVGCDGAHSTVRQRLGIEFTGEAEPNDWILADGHISGSIPHDKLSLFWHDEGVLAVFPFENDRYRIVADAGLAKGLDKPHTPTVEGVQAILDRRGPGGATFRDPVWLAGFRIHERKVATYGQGRAFLAGDAAHIHSPAGGQGMNTGMQDAYNLAWKLAFVQSGRFNHALLDTYTIERGAVGDMVLKRAGAGTRLATLRNPVGQFLRNKAIRLVGQFPGFRRTFVRELSETAIAYNDSPLNGSELSPGQSGTLRPGDRVPDVEGLLFQGQPVRLQRILSGPRFTQVVVPESGADLGELIRRVESEFPGLFRCVILAGEAAGAVAGADLVIDPRGDARRLFAAKAATLSLVRPDGYLAFQSPMAWSPLRGWLETYLR